jgi:meiosis-specific transcription factor NDT80
VSSIAKEHSHQHSTSDYHEVSGLSLPFESTETLWEVNQGDGQQIFPEIHCKVDKGFFLVDGDWTCYRRNYFTVEASYSLVPPTNPNELLQLKTGGQSALSSINRIRSFAVGLGACIEDIPER